jgi:hypothetical protein
MQTEGDVILRLSGVEQARRAMRRSALTYAARVLRQLDYPGAALALELEVTRRYGALARGTRPDLEVPE